MRQFFGCVGTAELRLCFYANHKTIKVMCPYFSMKM